jgi:hypothetical protein
MGVCSLYAGEPTAVSSSIDEAEWTRERMLNKLQELERMRHEMEAEFERERARERMAHEARMIRKAERRAQILYVAASRMNDARWSRSRIIEGLRNGYKAREEEIEAILKVVDTPLMPIRSVEFSDDIKGRVKALKEIYPFDPLDRIDKLMLQVKGLTLGDASEAMLYKEDP